MNMRNQGSKESLGIKFKEGILYGKKVFAEETFAVFGKFAKVYSREK